MVAQEILYYLEKYYLEFLEKGFDKEKYLKKCINIGKEITVISPTGKQSGIARDITQEGSLIAEIDGQLKQLSAGEVSISGILGYT